MKKYALIFPGQGSQYVGMGKSFFEGFASARETFEEASAALGCNIKKLVFEGPGEDLDMTENTQPALLTVSIAALRVLGERLDFTPEFYAGHSLGEYTALVAAGAVKFSDAVRLVRLRGRFMQEAVPASSGKMCAILGLDIKKVTEVCERSTGADGVVVPANINSPVQVVISGERAAVDRAAELAGVEGARRVVPLSVSAPSHSPLMAGAAGRLAEALEKTAFKDALVPVITNADAVPVQDAASIKKLLTKQLTSPVLWVDVVRKMKAGGVGTIVEIGPGKVLTGLVRRIDRDISTANLDTASDLDGAVELVSGK